jgi:hypothetical protein
MTISDNNKAITTLFACQEVENPGIPDDSTA